MWRLIRGGGLSYGYSMCEASAEGRVFFSLYRATNAVAAYTKAKSIVVSFEHSPIWHICDNKNHVMDFVIYKHVFHKLSFTLFNSGGVFV